ncbi:MAG TPA: hypothetical protein VMM93_08145 [Vicinamibacterales bacterium]|nr:hypothetical protein [Vicinamibacterales bacterium]
MRGRSVAGICFGVALTAAACNPSSPTPLSLSLTPGSLSLNAGEQGVFTVTAAGPATCTAPGGTVTKSGSTLTYTAPNESGFFQIKCEHGSQTVQATIAVTGPVTLEYSGGFPDHAAAP